MMISYLWLAWCEYRKYPTFYPRFKETQVIRLEQNYRSTATILQAANTLIMNNDTRMGKNLWTTVEMGDKIIVYRAINELDEARFVSERIKLQIDQGYRPDEIAVLYRYNAHLG